MNVVAIRDTKSVRSAEEVLRDRLDLPSVGDSNGPLVAVGVIVDRLLIPFKALHERKQVCPTNALGGKYEF